MRGTLVEADWEVEIGPGAPLIDARWPGFVDLRKIPELARQLPEVSSLRGLDDALVRLNGGNSPVWTSKCDVWPLDTAEFDPDEMDAIPESAAYGWGCYIDLLPRNDQQWIASAMAVSWCKSICGLLRGVAISCCRADLIVRSAAITPASMDIGITAYLTACGPTAGNANRVLQAALNKFVEALCSQSTIE
jgi:hypothetical protein